MPFRQVSVANIITFLLNSMDFYLHKWYIFPTFAVLSQANGSGVLWLNLKISMFSHAHSKKVKN
ncbi:hypothetical protein A8C56_00355 [Niabella ginsenosidivorans]|uniref:Uncharacterized protein n=1 Tax=Niabella ginsenosidivorans TaxID=1176587 RepID=A0A1A9HW42_9BACT|nr:hypothetical protein A8C56_00355 [Niabella ginsenosidivorans]